MKKKIKYIIPQIHNLREIIYIQWIGQEYYIKKINFIDVYNKYVLDVLELLLFVLILILGNIFPLKTFEDIIRLLLLAIVSGIQAGVAIANYINKNTK